MKTKWIGFLVIFFLIVVIGLQVYALLQDPKSPITKTAEITLNVKPAPDFTLTTNMTHIDTFVNRTIGFAASVESLNGFAGIVDFEVTGLPPEMIIAYFPAQSLTLGAGESKGIAVEIIIPANSGLIGDYTILVTAESTEYN